LLRILAEKAKCDGSIGANENIGILQKREQTRRRCYRGTFQVGQILRREICLEQYRQANSAKNLGCITANRRVTIREGLRQLRNYPDEICVIVPELAEALTN